MQLELHWEKKLGPVLQILTRYVLLASNLQDPRAVV